MSGGTASPRTTCPGGQLVRGDTWSSYNVTSSHVVRVIWSEHPVGSVPVGGGD